MHNILPPSTLLCKAHQSPLKTVVGKSGRNSGWNLEKAVQCKIIYSQQGYTRKKDLLSLFQREKYKEFLIKLRRVIIGGCLAYLYLFWFYKK